MRPGTAGRAVVTLLAFVGFLFAAVFPTRTYLAQRQEIERANERLTVLSEQNRRLEAEASRLERDEEIERLARAQHNLVRPGEEAYAIVASPVPGEEAAAGDALAGARSGSEDPTLLRLVERVVSAIL